MRSKRGVAIGVVALIAIAVVGVVVATFSGHKKSDNGAAPEGFTEHPSQAGDYRVRVDKRVVMVHLPKGYTTDKKKPFPVLFLLHGGDDDDPFTFISDTEMNPQADRDGYIVVCPIAQKTHKVFGKDHHSWKSRLGTLTEFDAKFDDDAQFAVDVRKWVMENLNADENNFSLGGLSEGSLMAQDIGQSDMMSINCLVLAGGTMLEGQQTRRPKKLPRHVLIQLNLGDDKILPLNNPDVVLGRFAGAAEALGYVNMKLSKPLLQESYWIDRFGEGGATHTTTSSETAVYRLDIHTFKAADGQERTVTVYRVKDGQHAWHGAKNGGDDDLRIKPRMDFPWPAILSKFIVDHRLK
jgi:poly(3-hydroxybutyrate) depolymerase